MDADTRDPASVARTYFERVDQGRDDVLDLFTDDIEFYFPKFGFGTGKDALVAMWVGLRGVIASIVHHYSDYEYLVLGDRLVVEGTSAGRYLSGETWSAGETPGGRFCIIFELEGDLIRRMRLYLDPDYTGADMDRFLWGREGRVW